MAQKTQNSITAAEMFKIIRNGDIKNVYLFYGEEEYLKSYFTKMVCARYQADRDSIVYFDGKVSPLDVQAASEANPLMMTNSVVIVRDSGIFKKASAEKGDGEGTAGDWDFLRDLAEESCVIFREDAADKRNAIYKLVSECGLVYECERQELSGVIKILTQEVNACGRRIAPGAINLLYTGYGKDIFLLLNEVDKLCMLVGEGEIIDEKTVKYATELSVEAKVFDLTDGIAENNKEKALNQLKALLADKVPAQVILATISTHFIRLNAVAKLNAKGLNTQEICAKLGLQDFLVKKYVKQAKGYTIESLDRVISLISDVDMRGKTGQLDVAVGLELLI